MIAMFVMLTRVWLQMPNVTGTASSGGPVRSLTFNLPVASRKSDPRQMYWQDQARPNEGIPKYNVKNRAAVPVSSFPLFAQNPLSCCGCARLQGRRVLLGSSDSATTKCPPSSLSLCVSLSLSVCVCVSLSPPLPPLFCASLAVSLPSASYCVQ
jgi:hypothetical protein